MNNFFVFFVSFNIIKALLTLIFLHSLKSYALIYLSLDLILSFLLFKDFNNNSFFIIFSFFFFKVLIIIYELFLKLHI